MQENEVSNKDAEVPKADDVGNEDAAISKTFSAGSKDAEVHAKTHVNIKAEMSRTYGVDSLQDADEPCDKEASESLYEKETVQRHEERHAMATIFDYVRKQSGNGQLVSPSDWEAFLEIPSHMNAINLQMLVFDYLEDERLHRQKEETDKPKQSSYRSASKAVGIPQMIVPKLSLEEDAKGANDRVEQNQQPDTDKVARYEKPDALDGQSKHDEHNYGDADDASVADNASVADDAGDANNADIANDASIFVPDGFELVELEGEFVLLPKEDTGSKDQLLSSDIRTLIGKQSYYLYSNEVMTDAYARWVFLANENDRIATFIECVRQESRLYPRPMSATGLKNRPFCMTDKDIDEIWDVVSNSGQYPDIQMTTASNGAIFYFSTDYLRPQYAASLAEWYAVEQDMYK